MIKFPIIFLVLLTISTILGSYTGALVIFLLGAITIVIHSNFDKRNIVELVKKVF